MDAPQTHLHGKIKLGDVQLGRVSELLRLPSFLFLLPVPVINFLGRFTGHPDKPEHSVIKSESV